MTTFTQFTPAVDSNFSFSPTLDGLQYTVVVTWGLFGQRWIMNLYTLQNVLIVTIPLTGSPDGYDINLVEGYGYTSTLVYRAPTNNFEVSP